MQMKPSPLILRFILITGLVLFICMAFRPAWTSPVKGSVTPSDAGLRAWLFSRTDTLNGSIIQGSFMITNVKPGNYTLVVEARPPYRDSFKQDVLVVEGQPTDVGVIQMNQ
jgi:hypothetical protein